jgi:cell wall-associated NlpC family hydrolase
MFNYKQKIAAVSSIVIFLTLGLTNCGSSTAEANQKLNIDKPLQTESSGPLFGGNSLSILEEGFIAEQKLLKQQEEARIKLISDTAKMSRTVKKLMKHLGSQYGRSGSTPGYWDCSGLVRWFYGQQGVDLRHSATAQSKSGQKTDAPKIGDIVAFHYGSTNWSFHTGIYVGDGKVLHAYNSISDTLISDVSEVAKENGASVSYRRIIETN